MQPRRVRRDLDLTVSDGRLANMPASTSPLSAVLAFFRTTPWPSGDRETRNSSAFVEGHESAAARQTGGQVRLETRSGASEKGTLQISDLRREPKFVDTVADRVWRAWWKPNGAPPEQISGGLAQTMQGKPIPFAVVAHDGNEFLGSTLGIESDLADRPQYSPWVAAVWVEPQHRLKQVGRALVGYAAQTCFARGFDRIYLCSLPARRNFYTRQGWVPIEENVGEYLQTVYVRDT